jgi:Histidine kinase-, DNA gyrase B-, and HSP90-like ATPase
MTIIPIETPVKAFDVDEINIQRTLLRQNGDPFDAIRELVSNSIDSGASVVWVDIRELPMNNTVKMYVIEVTDNGCGMSKDDLTNYAFKMFSSKNDDSSLSEKRQRISIFGIGLFSVLGMPGIKELIFLTSKYSSTGIHCARLYEKDLTFEIFAIPSGFDTIEISNDQYNVLLPLDIANVKSGTTAAVIFESIETLDILVKKGLDILSKYFFAIDDEIRIIYNDLKFDHELMLDRRNYIRINARPIYSDENLRIVDKDSLWQDEACKYSYDMIIDTRYKEDETGLFFLTGKGAVLKSYNEYRFLRYSEYSMRLDHCLISINSKDIMNYPISRSEIYATETLRSFSEYFFINKILPFSKKGWDIYEGSMLNNICPKTVPINQGSLKYFLQDLVCYLAICRPKGLVAKYYNEFKKWALFPIVDGRNISMYDLELLYNENGRIEFIDDRQYLLNIQNDLRFKHEQVRISTSNKNISKVLVLYENLNLGSALKKLFQLERVSSKYRLELLPENLMWLNNAIQIMISRGKYSIDDGLEVLPRIFLDWGGAICNEPPLEKDVVGRKCYINIHNQWILPVIELLQGEEHTLAGHIFELIYIRDQYSNSGRRDALINDALKRLNHI